MIQIPVTVDEVEEGIDSWGDPGIAPAFNGEPRRVLVKGFRTLTPVGGGAPTDYYFEADIRIMQHGNDAANGGLFSSVRQQFLISIEEVTE